ncbi:MAG: TonB-dependent receptor [Bradyrhizobiaceae bacterium]|nr:TonB-dependent receptor [Bradyrhizobiaceae bacterium]
MARTKTLAPLLLLTISDPLLAQTVTELPQVVISAHQFPIEATRVGSAVTVLEGDRLRADGVSTVADALRTVPGVSFAQSGTRGSLTSVFLRGADPRNLLIQIDGIEVNQLGFPGFDFADLPIDDIERIEVIRGPQSGIYGANANAGVISIITRSGRGLAGSRFEGRLEGGMQNTLGGSANLRGASGPFYGSLTASGYRADGYNIARDGHERDGSRATVVTAKGGVDINEFLNIEGVVRFTDRFAESDVQDFACVVPGAFPCVPVDPATYGLITDSIGHTAYRSLASRVGATLTLFDGHWVQSVAAKRFDEKTRSLDAQLGPFGAEGTRIAYEYKSTLKFDTNLAGGERHVATLLLDRRSEDYIQSENPAHFVKRRLGLAGEYVLDLPSHTTLSGALRHDWNSALEDVWTWRLALSQRLPATGTRIHASYGKGITDPDVFQLFGSSFNLPNPALQPEHSIGWDVGVEQRWFGRLTTDVTYFSTEFTNKVDLVFDAGLGGLIYRNGAGIARRHGIETTATLELSDWWTVSGAYTYTDARNSFGTPEVRRPRHSASFETTLRSKDGRGSATVGVVHNSTRRDFYFRPTETLLVELPGATVLRAMLSYQWTPSTTAYVRAENLLDRRYEEILSYRMPPFALFAGLRVKLGAE